MHLEKYTCSAAPVCRLVLFPRFSAPCSFFLNFIFTIFNQVFDWRIFFATQVGTSQSSPVLVLIFANSFSALGLAASLIFHIFKSTSSWKNLVFFFNFHIFQSTSSWKNLGHPRWDIRFCPGTRSLLPHPRSFFRDAGQGI